MSVLFPIPPPPKTLLGYYRMLAPNASVRVSPLCLGGMNFGNIWKNEMGECDKQTTFGILDYFYEAGGNFIDTANGYQRGQSEQWIGEWMKERGNRDQMVIATKYTTTVRAGFYDKEIMINTCGNGTKSLHYSLEASLKNLQTSYIDLLFVHWWDFTCSIPEMMQSLDVMVKQGKVLYLGISDTPAWVVSKANEYARQRGLRQFSVYQGSWSAMQRDFERDLIPMCIDEGMGIMPFGVLGNGHFKTEEGRKEQNRRNMGKAPEAAIKISKVLEKIAAAKNTELTSIALAYVMHKTPYVFPIVGGRKIDHLKGNIEALKVSLSDEDIAEIENVVPFDLGFPLNLVGGPAPEKVILRLTSGAQVFVAPSRPIGAVPNS